MAASVLPSPAEAYRINTTERGKRIRWAVDTVVLRVDPAYAEMLPGHGARDALVMAFDAWRGFPGVPDLFVKDEQPDALGHHNGGPTNGIYFVEDWPYEADKLAVTVVTYELSTGRLLDADVLVNAHVPFALYDEQAPVEAPSAYDIAAVLTHEAGHMLGLGESDADPMATMWPYARMGDTHQRTLSADDEDGIIAAYAGPPPQPAAGCGGASVVGRPRALPFFWQLALCVILLALCAGAVRRRRFGTRLGVLAGMGLLLSGGGLGPASAPASDGPHTAQAAELARHLYEAIPAADPRARPLLTALMADDASPRLGTVRRAGVLRDGGLLYTEYTVRHDDGTLATLRVPGGEADGIGQRVGHGELPRDGERLLIARPSDGTQRWAFAAEDGELHGGWLGHARITGVSW